MHFCGKNFTFSFFLIFFNGCLREGTAGHKHADQIWLQEKIDVYLKVYSVPVTFFPLPWPEITE